MRNLVYFFNKYRLFFLFVFLQLICLYLIIQNQNFHRASYINSANNVTGFFYNVSSGVTDYFHLKKANEQLKNENAQLRSLINGSYRKINEKFIEVNDTIYLQQYKYLPVKVINSSTNNKLNYLTINKGYADGIEKNMGVIGPQGLVGFTKDISSHFATVVPVIHQKFKASVKLKKNNYTGILSWELDDDAYTATISGIPKHVKLILGDTVVTRGASGMYPENINVGFISEFSQKPGSNYFDIKINLAADFHNIYYVEVVKNILKQEKKELEELTEGEGND